MSFHINACLVDGNPCLELFDSHSGDCRLRWQYNRNNKHSDDQLEVQKLFHQLIRLTCQQEAANVRVFWTGEPTGHKLGNPWNPTM